MGAVTTAQEAQLKGASLKQRLWRVARSGGAIAVADQALVSGVNFLTAQLLFAYGSKEVGGAYALAWVLVLFARSTVINLVATPYTVRRGRGEARFAAYSASSFLQQLTISLSAAGVLFLLGGFFLWRTPDAPLGQSLGYTFLAAAVVTPLLMAREYARQISFAHHAPLAALTLDFVAGAAQLAFLYGLLEIAVGAPIAYLASGAGALLGVAAWWAFGIQKVRFSRTELRGDWSENWQFGRWALVSQVTGNLAPLPWIVYVMWGAGETGSFDGANRIVGLSNILVLGYCNFLSAAAATAFAREGSSALKQVIFRAVMIFSIGLGGLCVCALIWGGDLLTLVMRGKIDNVGGIVAILAFATLLDGLSQVALNGLRAMNRPADAVVADLVEVAVTLVSGITLVALFSAPGAAWAMVFGRLAGLLLRWRAYFWRIDRAPITPLASAPIASGNLQ